MVGAIGGRLGATEYHVVHSGPIQGLSTCVVIVGINRLGDSPPPLVDPMLTLALFGLKGFHDHCSHALIEWLDPLGCPLLKGLEEPSHAYGRPLLLASTMVIIGVTTFLSCVIPGQPHLGGTNGFPF